MTGAVQDAPRTSAPAPMPSHYPLGPPNGVTRERLENFIIVSRGDRNPWRGFTNEGLLELFANAPSRGPGGKPLRSHYARNLMDVAEWLRRCFHAKGRIFVVTWEDAIVGRGVPRAGRSHRELLSHGRTSLKTYLEAFEEVGLIAWGNFLRPREQGGGYGGLWVELIHPEWAKARRAESADVAQLAKATPPPRTTCGLRWRSEGRRARQERRERPHRRRKGTPSRFDVDWGVGPPRELPPPPALFFSPLETRQSPAESSPSLRCGDDSAPGSRYAHIDGRSQGASHSESPALPLQHGAAAPRNASKSPAKTSAVDGQASSEWAGAGALRALVAGTGAEIALHQFVPAGFEAQRAFLAAVFEQRRGYSARYSPSRWDARLRAALERLDRYAGKPGAGAADLAVAIWLHDDYIRCGLLEVLPGSLAWYVRLAERWAKQRGAAYRLDRRIRGARRRARSVGRVCAERFEVELARELKRRDAGQWCRVRHALRVAIEAEKTAWVTSPAPLDKHPEPPRGRWTRLFGADNPRWRRDWRNR